MESVIKRSVVSTLSVGVVFSGFAMGRHLSTTGAQPVPGTPSLSNRLTANAREGAFDDAGLSNQADTNVPPDEIFEAVLEHVHREFVEGYGDARLSSGALARMFASFDDPKTNYLEPTLRQARQQALAGAFHGIGAVLTISKSRQQDIDYHHLTVVDVMPDSPAQKAGLRSGDHITEINGRWIIAYGIAVDYDRLVRAKEDDTERRADVERVSNKFQKGYTLARALSLLTIGEGKTLRLTVERGPQTTPFKLTVTTGETDVAPVEYKVLANRIAYLRVRQFNGRATTAFQESLNKLDQNIKGLVLDLRANPGGVKGDATASGIDGYASALKLIGRLAPAGPVAQIERRPNRRETLRVANSSPVLTMPLAVLVDEGTANLAELVATSVHNAGRAKLIGRHTFGDNVLQLFAVLKSGAGVEMNTARLLTLRGVDWSRGLDPDVIVAEKSDGDATLRRALSMLGV